MRVAVRRCPAFASYCVPKEVGHPHLHPEGFHGTNRYTLRSGLHSPRYQQLAWRGDPRYPGAAETERVLLANKQTLRIQLRVKHSRMRHSKPFGEKRGRIHAKQQEPRGVFGHVGFGSLTKALFCSSEWT